MLGGRSRPGPSRGPVPARAPSSRPRPPARLPASWAPSPSAPAPAHPPSTPPARPTSPAPIRARRSRWLIITPAVAGPFDLGTVVVRAALYVDPETAQVTVVSDPIPTILQGIPLDVRSIAVKVDRPDFTLNPTSCEPMAITGGSDLDPPARSPPLNNRFQVGGCTNLGFKPKLALKPQRRHQARRPPGPDRDPDLSQQGRLRQHRQSPGRPAALGVPRHHPHQDDLHQGAVRRQTPAPKARSTASPGRSRRCSTSRWKARSTCSSSSHTLPGPGRRPERPDPRRPGRTSRLDPRRHPQHLRSRPRRPGLQVHPEPACRQEGPTAKQHRHLQGHPQSNRQVHRPQRQDRSNSPRSWWPSARRRASKKKQKPSSHRRP